MSSGRVRVRCRNQSRGEVVVEVGEQLRRTVAREALNLLSGLTVGDGHAECVEGAAGQVDRLGDRVDECEMFEIREALEDASPVVAGADVVRLTVEDVAKLGGLNG